MGVTDVTKYPLEMMWIVPRREGIYAFEIVARNVASAHKVIHDVFISVGARVIYEFHSGIGEDKVIIFIAIDVSDTNLIADDFLELLKEKRDIVLDVKEAGHSNRFYYADMLFPIHISRSRAVIFDNATLKGMLIHFRNNFGEDGASAMLFHIGQAIGESIYKSYIKPKTSSGSNLRKVFDNLKPILHSKGWGEVLGIECEPYKIVIKIRDHWECSILKDAGFNKPTGQLFRGMLTTVTWKLHGKRVSVIEKKCLTMGDNFCEFEITPLEGSFQVY